MAARHRPAKCLFYYKGYCTKDYTTPKQCSGVCDQYVHYDLNKKNKTKFIEAFSEGEKKDE